MLLRCLKLFLICCLCSLSSTGLREMGKTCWVSGREAGKPEAETKVGLVLKNKWPSMEWHFLVILFSHSKCARYSSIINHKCMHIYIYTHTPLHVCVCKYRLHDCWKSETWRTEAVLMWFQRLDVTHLYLHSGDFTLPHQSTHNSLLRLTAVITPRAHPSSVTQGLPLHQAVRRVSRVTCMIILCIICFALSLVAPISIWISLCLAFFPNTSANLCSENFIWQYLFGFSSHVYMYFWGGLSGDFSALILSVRNNILSYL